MQLFWSDAWLESGPSTVRILFLSVITLTSFPSCLLNFIHSNRFHRPAHSSLMISDNHSLCLILATWRARRLNPQGQSITILYYVYCSKDTEEQKIQFTNKQTTTTKKNPFLANPSHPSHQSPLHYTPLSSSHSTHTHTHTHARDCVHACIHTRAHTVSHTHARACTRARAHTDTQTHTHMHCARTPLLHAAVGNEISLTSPTLRDNSQSQVEHADVTYVTGGGRLTEGDLCTVTPQIVRTPQAIAGCTPPLSASTASQHITPDRLVGLVVKAPASRDEDPGSESRLRRDFSGSSYTGDSKIGTPVATLPDALRYTSAMGLVGPVSVNCDWVRWKV